MNLTKILTGVLLLASLFLAYLLYRSVQGTIEERATISTTEDAIVEKLKLIREAEIVFQSVNKRYTSNWDSLANFIRNGQVPIIQRREEITQKAYGVEEVKVIIDTLGFVSAKDRIFTKTYYVNSPDNGTFLGYKVKEGDRVIKNQKTYALRVNEKVVEPPMQDEGTISKLEPIKVGSELKKGQQLITLTNYMFNPNVDLATLGNVPGQGNLKFDIFVGVVEKGGLKVQVIEVKDPKPVNPIRRESNEAKNRKPLHFGSRFDISTSGNWE
jgi:biotin carboxyl carrier protein